MTGECRTLTLRVSTTLTVIYRMVDACVLKPCFTIACPAIYHCLTLCPEVCVLNFVASAQYGLSSYLGEKQYHHQYAV